MGTDVDTDIEKLIVLNLKYSNRERSLNRYVFADFSLKALFQITRLKPKADRQKSILMVDIYSMLSKLLGLKGLPRQTILEALDLLSKDNKIIGSRSSGWYLKKEVYSDIDKKLKNEDAFIEEMLKRYFPRDIKPTILKEWFYEVSARLFGEFGDSLVANISGNGMNRSMRPDLVKIIASVTKLHKLNGKKSSLLSGYENFIDSSNMDDLKLISDLAIRWFSARLVVANVGRDPITIDQIKGSKFILDTNVLIALALEKKPFTKSIEALGKALKEIDAELVYIPTSSEEYTYTADYQANLVMKLLSTYGVEKIKGLEVEEDFITAGLVAGCNDENSFKKYFLKMRNVPSSIKKGPDITLDEDEKIDKIITDAGHDTDLLKLIKSTKTELTSRIPSDSSLRHDSALIRVAEFLSEDEGRKVWVLTLDNGLKHVGIKVGGTGMPVVMGVDTLIEFLALSTAGSKLTNADFAPLLANILKNHCLPFGGQAIRLSDLIQLQATIRDAPNLPIENIKRMATLIARVRIENRSIESPEVQNELITLQNKEYEKIDQKVQNAQNKVREANMEKSTAQEETEKERVILKKLQKIATKDRSGILRSRLINKLVLLLLIRLLVVALVLIVANNVTKNAFDSNPTALQITVDLTGLALFCWWVFEPIKSFLANLNRIDEVAQDEIDSQIT